MLLLRSVFSLSPAPLLPLLNNTNRPDIRPREHQGAPNKTQNAGQKINSYDQAGHLRGGVQFLTGVTLGNAP
jgi:hypothetical protein